jgi:uncharacterized membrane protein (DUF485 family)
MATAPSPVTDQKEHRELVRDLAGAVSAQAQVANRSWLALTTVALYALIPHTANTVGKIALPFNLGEVEPIWFHGLVFYMLAVLAIVFASAHTQQVRAQKLAQKAIDSLGDSLGGTVGCLIHPREYFDIWRTPSLIRVAPLAQALRGKYQFFSTSHGLSQWRKRFTVTYYGLLKVVSLVVYFLLPVLALWRAYGNASMYGVPHWSATIGVSLATAALVPAFWWDFIYAVEILRHLGKQPASNT